MTYNIHFVSKDLRETSYRADAKTLKEARAEIPAMFVQVKSDYPEIEFTHAYIQDAHDNTKVWKGTNL